MANLATTIPVTLSAVPQQDSKHNGTSARWNFLSTLRGNGLGQLQRLQIRELQVNVGKLCNQACNHCHVDAGPNRTEIMSWNTMENIVAWCNDNEVQSVDITGGAPELNPDFRRFVDACLAVGMTITSRCNLTVLLEPGEEDLARWYADRQVKLICSLPCYTKDNLEQQRGKGVFDRSIRALQLLNELGYGINPSLSLDLVYNPNGAYLPPSEQQLESTYKERLGEDFGIQFNRLYTLTNLPVSRFRHYLERTGDYERYMDLLLDVFNPETVPHLMCRHMLSVDWLGRIYDCDFNQMLDIAAGWRKRRYLWEQNAEQLIDQRIAVDSHCFGCTAGAGSSCGGTLS